MTVQVESALTTYDAALLRAADGGHPNLVMRYACGYERDLDIARWSGQVDAADLELLDRVSGPVLDIGCGPGRLAAELTRRGVNALGIDISPVAVELAQRRDAQAWLGDVFSCIPGEGMSVEGGWQHLLLIDGNIGIGGDMERLLCRARELMHPTGTVHVELLNSPHCSSCDAQGLGQLELDGSRSPWFPWVEPDEAALVLACRRSGFRVTERWDRDGRHVVALSLR